VNRLTLSGNVLKAPEVKEVKGGAKLCVVTIRSPRAARDGAAPKADVLVLEGWREVAERLSRLAVGDRIVCDAAVRSSEWTATDGTPRSRMTIVVNGFEILAPSGLCPAAEAAAAGVAADADSIPF